MEVERARQFRSQRSEPVRDSTLSDYVTRNNFTDEARRFLDQAARTFTLSGRALRKACTVARTIADLSGSEEVDLASIAESMQYRNDWMDSRANHEV